MPVVGQVAEAGPVVQLRVDVAEVAFDVAQLLADGGADFGGFGFLGERDGEEVAAGLLAVSAGLPGFAGHGGMKVIDDALGFLPRIVEQLEISRIGDVGGRAGGVDDEFAVGFGLGLRGWNDGWLLVGGRRFIRR